MSNAPRIDRLEKNYLINGGLDFWQRGGASSSVNVNAGSSYVGPDRFRTSYSGTTAGAPQLSRVATGLSSPARVKYDAQWNVTLITGPLTMNMEQRIEGIEAREIAYAGSASFSVWVNSGSGGTTSVSVTLNVPTVEDNYSSVTQIFTQSTTISSNTWTKITATNISIPSSASRGISVVVSMTPAASIFTSVNFLFSEFVLNIGSFNSDFSRYGGSIGRELQACQRYYEKSFDIDTAATTNSGTINGAYEPPSSVSGASPIRQGSGVRFMALKRAVPTITFYNPQAANNQMRNRSKTNDAATTATEALGSTGFSCTIAGQANWVVGDTLSVHWSADAEL